MDSRQKRAGITHSVTGHLFLLISTQGWRSMQTLVKLLISLAVIYSCVAVGRRYPSLAGLIATMPITTLLVLFWLYSEGREDYERFAAFTRGVVWGIIPSVLFFLTATWCFRKGIPFPATIAISFGAWLMGAILHQLLLR
jgi:uncharacterized membrane protein (GlpM family)